MLRSRSRPRRVACRTPFDEDARALALELAELSPPQTISGMTVGLVLEPGEVAWRAVSLQLRHRLAGSWSQPSECRALVTSRRVLVQLPTTASLSLWWGSLVGFQPRIAEGYVVLDYGDGSPRMLSGPYVGVVAVAGVACLYGVTALAEHPALEPLRGDVR